VRDGIRSAVAAISFLTALPVGRRIEIREHHLAAGLAMFPIVGGVVGLVMALIAVGAASVLPPFPAAVLGVSASVILTAALHLDGLADTADGLGASLAGRDPVAAMVDPRAGVAGVAAVALDLLLKVSVVAAFVDAGGFPWVFVAAGALSRGSVLALMLAIPYAGSDAGAGAWLRARAGRTAGAIGILAMLVIGAVTDGLAFVAMLVAAALVAVLVGRWSGRTLGGMRGDTFGAAAELTESLGLVAVLAVS
jgi:adenosylcobinamide-GDP ribazoletransferase